MKRIFKLIKKSRKTKLITLIIIIGTIVIGISGGKLIVKEIAIQKQILLEQKQEDDAKKLQQLKEDIKSFNEKINGLIQDENVLFEKINEKLQLLEIEILNENIDIALEKEDELIFLISELIEIQKPTLVNEMTHIKERDISAFSEETKAVISEKVKEIENLISKDELKVASEKINDIKSIIEQ